MFPNLLNMRIGAIIAGVILLIVLAASGAIPGFHKKGVIQIDWSIERHELAGLEVEIDGQVAGTLRRFGNACRTGFEVKEGSHEVRVLHPEMDSASKRVDVFAGGLPVLLILDFEEHVDENGAYVTTLGFQ